jgi:sirohydrochlorin ferrochelatase
MLLIAHGSRRKASNEEVRELARRIEGMDQSPYARVIPAFLELAEPDIPTGVALCEEAGAKDVIVIPYFLSAGRHVAEDIPRELEAAAKAHPKLVIRLAEHIGQHEEMPRLLLKAKPAG